MLKRYPQLQSGFISGGETLLLKPVKEEQTVVGSLISGAKTHTQDEFFYSPAIDALVNEALQDPLKFRDLDFQGRLFETIGKVFEKQSFSFFVRLQENDLGLSSSHVLFLEETVNLALGYTPQRSVSVQTWASLLSAVNPACGGFRSSEFFKKFQHSEFLKMTLSEFLVAWVQRGGFSDLLLSMQVIFGRRGLHGIFGAKY